ncbi:MAG: DUF5801 domain-containing protein [Xanthobacteraceae bacterium]|nr:DUF5801 domain-containing protein [Xanthobacteraceae bacterium]
MPSTRTTSRPATTGHRGRSVAITGDLNVSWGADDADPDTGAIDRKLEFTTSAAPGGLTSDGVAVVYDVTTNPDGNETLTAYKGSVAPGNEVFTVVLNDDGTGSYTFTLIGNLDHATGGGQNDLQLTFGFNAVDSDGDAAPGSFRVNVHDDVVLTGTTSQQTVDEDNLSLGPLSLSGIPLNVSWGADDGNATSGGGLGDRAIAFASATPGANVSYSGSSSMSGLTSNGNTVLFVFLGAVLVGYVDPASAGAPANLSDSRIVLTASLSDAGDADDDILIAGGTSNQDDLVGGGGDDLLINFGGGASDDIDGGDGDDTAIIGSNAGRMQGGAGLDQAFVVNSTVLTAGGITGFEYIEIMPAVAGDGVIQNRSNALPLDFSLTTLVNVDRVNGGANADNMFTAASHVNVGGDGIVLYDGKDPGNPNEFGSDRINVTLQAEDFVGSSFSTGLVKDLKDLAAHAGPGLFTFDDTASLPVQFQNFELFYVNYQTLAGDFAQARNTAFQFAGIPGGTLNGTSGNDVLVDAAGNREFLNGGDGDDLLVSTSGGIDELDGSDGNDTFISVGSSTRVYRGGDGLDQILHVGSSVLGIQSISGVEKIEIAGGNGTIRGNGSANTYDFTGVEFVGVSRYEEAGSGVNFSRVVTETKADFVTYVGTPSSVDRITIVLTDAQLADPAVKAEILDFFTQGGPEDFVFNSLKLAIEEYETVFFHDGLGNVLDPNNPDDFFGGIHPYVADGQVTVEVVDEVPDTALSSPVALTVDEDDLDTLTVLGAGSDGSSPSASPEDPNSSPDTPDVSITNADGSVSPIAPIVLAGLVDFGADGAHAVDPFALKVVATPVNTGLESQDGAILIVSDGTVLTGYVDDDSVPGFDAAGDRIVFELTLVDQATGELRFKLFDQIDHPAGSGENLLAAPIDFSSYILVKDGDGDTTELAAGSVTIDVRDDTPLASIAAADVTVSIDETPGLQGPPPSMLIFSANGGNDVGREVYRVKPDGTVELVDNINTGPSGNSPGQDANPQFFTEFNGALYFAARDGVNGNELYRIVFDSNGVPTVELVENIKPGNGNSNPRDFTVFKDWLYFVANSPSSSSGDGTDLFRVTLAGTVEPVDVNPGHLDSTPREFTIVGDTLFFTARLQSDGREVFRIDANGDLHHVEIDLGTGGSNPTGLTAFAGSLWVSANPHDGTTGEELYRIFEDGTFRLIDINPAGGADGNNGNPTSMFAFNGALYLSAQGPGTGGANVGEELFRITIDGNNDEHVEFIADLRAGSPASTPQQFHAFDGSLYFVANGDNGLQLYRLDDSGPGTPTVTQVVINASGASANQSQINQGRAFDFIEFQGSLYFAADGGTAVGVELYRINSGAPGIAELVANIAPAGPNSFPQQFVEFAGGLYFQADGPSGVELYRLTVDGANVATVTLIDINSGGSGSNSNPTGFTVLGNTLYFSALDNDAGQDVGTELFKITAADPTNPVLVANINPGSGGSASSNPEELTGYPAAGGSSDEIDPADLPAAFAVIGGTPLAAAHGADPVATVTLAVAGADEPLATVLSLAADGSGNAFPASGAGVPSGLFDTATGEQIYLYALGDLVVGRVGSAGVPDDGGDVSFALYVDNAGTLFIAQYLALQHGDPNNGNDFVTLDGLVHVKVTVTDFDGDPVASATATSGITIKFYDDGPPVATNDAATTDEDTAVLVDVLNNDTFSVDGRHAVTPIVIVGATFGTAVVVGAAGSEQIEFTPDTNYNGPATITYRIMDGDGDLSAPATVTVTVNSVVDQVFTSGDDLVDLGAFANHPAPSNTTDNPWFEDGNFLNALGGNDTVTLPNAADPLGDDYAALFAANQTFQGGAGNDTITGGDLDDRIAGGLDDDTIDGGAGDDIIFYTAGDGRDSVDGGSEAVKDVLDVTRLPRASTSRSHRDRARVRDANRATYTRRRRDRLLGRRTNVLVDVTGIEDIVVHGGGGSDTLTVSGSFAGTSSLTSTIHFNGGDGDDTIDVSGRDSAHRVVADGGDEDAEDSVVLGFDFASLPPGAYVEVFDGPNLVGVQITHEIDGETVVDEFTNFEQFVFTDGTRTLEELFNQPPDTDPAAASGDEDDTSIEVVLTGSDPDAGDAVVEFRIVTLPANGALYRDAALTDQILSAGETVAASSNSASVWFVPDADWNGTTDFTFAARDGSGAEDASPATATIDVDPVNDPPSAASATVTTDEDTAYVFQTADFGFADPVEGDALLNVIVTAAPDEGTLLLDGTPIGSYPAAVSAQDIADGKLTFEPAANANGAGYASFEFRVQDDGGTANGGIDTSAPATLTIDVTPVNDPPEVDLDTGASGNGHAVTFTEGDAAVAISAAASVADVDHLVLQSATITLTNPADGAFESLSLFGALPAGISIDLGESTPHKIVMVGAASPADYAAAVDLVRYENTSEDPTAGDRTIEVVVNDGVDESAPAVSTVTVVPVNDLPTDIRWIAAPPAAGNALPLNTHVIATLLATDADHASGFTYELVSASHAIFDVSSSGTVSLTANMADATPYELVVKVTDPAGGEYQETFNIVTGVVTGSNGVDEFDGGTGNDTFNGLAGDDRFYYAKGEGADTVDGGADHDTQYVIGTNAAETFDITAVGPTIDIDIDGSQALTLNGVEDIVVQTGGGGDTVTISGDFGPTDLDVSTITVEGSGDSETLDLGGLTSNHRVVFNASGGNDTFISGAGDDVFDGGAGTDVAEMSGAFAGATWSLVGDTLTIDGADGSDSLKGVEQVEFSDTTLIVVDQSGNYGGAYTTIAAAVAAAGSIVGHVTIVVGPGVYNENVVLNRANLALVGVGDATEIHGTFKTSNGLDDATGSVATFLQTALAYTPSAGAGVTVAADNTTITNLKIESFNVGIELGSSTHTRIEGVTIEDTVTGIRKGTAANVTDLDIVGGRIFDGHHGIILYKTASGPQATGMAQDVQIIGTTFEDLNEKGIYAETLKDGLISGVTMTDVGEFGRGPAFGGTGPNTSGFGNGIDINLKNGTYSNITITDFTFENVGSSDGDGSAHTHGAAIAVKVRDDAPSYSGAPATWSGAPLVISDGTIDGTSTGIRVGEPGTTNAGPPVNVTDVSITGEEHSAIHGDVDNVSTALTTVVLTGDADALLPAPTSTGPFHISGLGGADTIGGGQEMTR